MPALRSLKGYGSCIVDTVEPELPFLPIAQDIRRKPSHGNRQKPKQGSDNRIGQSQGPPFVRDHLIAQGMPVVRAAFLPTKGRTPDYLQPSYRSGCGSQKQQTRLGGAGFYRIMDEF